MMGRRWNPLIAAARATGGAPGPDDAPIERAVSWGLPWQRGQGASPDAAAQLMANYRRYTEERVDPMAALREGGAAQAAPGGLVQMAQGGPRAGRAHHAYVLPDGRRAHVYFDGRGRRRVMVF